MKKQTEELKELRKITVFGKAIGFAFVVLAMLATMYISCYYLLNPLPDNQSKAIFAMCLIGTILLIITWWINYMGDRIVKAMVTENDYLVKKFKKMLKKERSKIIITKVDVDTPKSKKELKGTQFSEMMKEKFKPED